MTKQDYVQALQEAAHSRQRVVLGDWTLWVEHNSFDYRYGPERFFCAQRGGEAPLRGYPFADELAALVEYKQMKA